MDAKKLKIVFIDGDCLFCYRMVELIKRFDMHRQLYFAPLNGETFFQIYGHRNANYESVILFQNSNSFMKGRALIEIAKSLGGIFWGLAMGMSLLPTFALDGIYNLVAKNRHSLNCKSSADRSQFLP